MVNPATKPDTAECNDAQQESVQTAPTCRFSADDLADIADCFERYTGHAAWAGYGFTEENTDELDTIYLFSSGFKGGRLTLRQPRIGQYELLSFDGELLWCGSQLTEFAKVLIPQNKE